MHDIPPGYAIRIRGVVQGVGFRPHVWHLAQQLAIKGWVKNDAAGVMIHAWAEPGILKEFVSRLQQDAPPLAKVQEIIHSTLADTQCPPDNFTIHTSDEGAVNTDVSADAATCPECLAEIRDPNNRRYRYPFTNCTHCGPRFSIIKRIPYDRANTSMSVFPLCASCSQEYHDPADRRFHAQPTCCPDCGPQLWLEDRQGKPVNNFGYSDPIIATAELLKQGMIVAIKGIGGFHLACDATNQQAVTTLRQRKRRYHKAFALMAKDCEQIRQFAFLDAQQEAILRSPSAPILVLQKKLSEQNVDLLPDNIAPQQSCLGFMLPYSPLHYLLMDEFPNPIVLTSGNLSDEPQAITNQQAHEQLNGIADYYLLHDRDIINRMDDSVIKVMGGESRTFRLGRGLAPQQIPLPEGFDQTDGILAMGSDLKNTFCLIKNGQAIISQHIGDLEEVRTQLDYRHQIELYKNLYQFEPQTIVIDKHPNYHSSDYGKQLAVESNITLIEVQHHHAHITSCMAEHGIPLNSEKVLGIALDGLGFGDDGNLWGGEFLLADYTSSQRIGCFKPVAMLGGSQAAREPWRNTLSQLLATNQFPLLLQQYSDLAFFQFLEQQPLEILTTMAEKGLNSPKSSSAGRLFEAAAALLGICTESQSFEGQAAMALESMASKSITQSNINRNHCFYKIHQVIHYNQGIFQMNWQPIWLQILEDLKNKKRPKEIAANFHSSVTNAICELVSHLHREHSFYTIVLSGGVLQNKILLEQLQKQLSHQGYKTLTPRQLPSNDGGISLGQAAIGFALSTFKKTT